MPAMHHARPPSPRLRPKRLSLLARGGAVGIRDHGRFDLSNHLRLNCSPATSIYACTHFYAHFCRHAHTHAYSHLQPAPPPHHHHHQTARHHGCVLDGRGKTFACGMLARCMHVGGFVILQRARADSKAIEGCLYTSRHTLYAHVCTPVNARVYTYLYTRVYARVTLLRRCSCPCTRPYMCPQTCPFPHTPKHVSVHTTLRISMHMSMHMLMRTAVHSSTSVPSKAY